MEINNRRRAILEHPQEHEEKVSETFENRFVTANELLGLNIKDVPRLWDPFISQVGLSGLVGSSDCGKSTILRQLAISVALREKEFLGFPLNVTHGRAIYISTEDNAYSTSPSIGKQLNFQKQELLDNLKFLFINSNDYEEMLKEELKKAPADLIVIDSFADLFQGDFNRLSDVRKALSPLVGIANKFNTAVVILHHTVKNSEFSEPNKNKVNGSQALEAKARSIIELRSSNINDEKYLSLLKGNYVGKDFKKQSFILEFDESTLLFKNSNKKIDKNQLGNSKKYDNPDVDSDLFKYILEEGRSFNDTYERLVANYGKDQVPKITQLKERVNKEKLRREKIGRTEPKETDRPTSPEEPKDGG